MKAIVIGAGTGKRINEFSKKSPKALLDINGKTILSRQVSLFRKNGINEIIVITGPYWKKFDLKNITYIHDSQHAKHDILGSLMEARSYINDELLITYSDILFEESILHQVLQSNSDIGIAVDLDWEESYKERTNNPKSEAENVLLNKDNQIIQIKKNIQNSKGRIGEFLGMVKLSAKGSKTLIKAYESLKSYQGRFHDSPLVSKAYLTDMFQELIDSKIRVTPIFISGKWCEIDTSHDLKRACKLFS